MVIGLQTFRQFFADYADSYILIGGCACDLNLAQLELAFRATHDLDIVLCVEAHNADFIRAFWDFIRTGNYSVGEKSTGEKHFYRFKNPTTPDFPVMLELFSRRPEAFSIADGSRLTPIPADEEISSLSAILLDDDYYRFIHNNRIIIDGLSLVSPIALIVLKAKAWMDLTDRKAKGESIDSKSIGKHKNDIVRLVPAVSADPVTLPPVIQQEMNMFLARYMTETLDTKALRVPLSADDIKKVLARIFSNII